MAAIPLLTDVLLPSLSSLSIEDMEMAPVPEEAHGMFFGGDSYVIKYSYQKEGRDQYIVYFWQVRPPPSPPLPSLPFPSVADVLLCVL